MEGKPWIRPVESISPSARRLLGLMLILLVMGRWNVSAFGAEQPETCRTNSEFKVESVAIGLNNTGVADLRFANPRRPYPLVVHTSGEPSSSRRTAYRQCLTEAQITFENRSAGRSFIVTTSYLTQGAGSIRRELPPAITEIEQALAAVRLQFGDNERIEPETWELLDLSLKNLRSLAEKSDVAPDRLLKHLLAIRTNCTSAGGGCGALIGILRTSLPPGDRDRALAVLAPPIDRLDDMARKLTKSIDIVRAGEAQGTQCTDRSDGKRSCKLAIRLHERAQEVVEGAFWKAIVGSQPNVVEFSVSFFDENGLPSNSKVLIASTPEPSEPESESDWKVVAGIGGFYRPAVDTDPTDDVKERFSPIRPEGDSRCGPPDSQDRADCGPYEGDRLSTYNGNGRLELAQTLGGRASASVVLGFKSGDLGDGKTKQDVTVDQYRIDVFSRPGAIFRFGQYAMAAPSSSRPLPL